MLVFPDLIWECSCYGKEGTEICGKMFVIGKSGYQACENSLYYSCNSSVRLKLFPVNK